MAYQLQITTAQGAQILPLDGIENGNIPADPSASYTLIDEQGNPVTEDLELTRKGDNLTLEVEGESVANIEEFYTVDGSQYVVDGSQPLIDGSAAAESTVISSSGVDASGNIIAEGVVWQAETSFLGLSTLQLVGAGLGSAVAVGAAASGSDSGSSSNATSTPDTTAPEITSGTTATAINENTGANQIIYTVTATDDNAVTYSLSGDDASLFTIDSATGDVTLIADPDYETQSSYNFNVVATDEAGNESEQAVSLDINDVDEIAPEITSGTTAADIDENSGANQVVYTITATDDNPLTYSLSGDDASLFTIDTSTGEVTLTADPDYETQSSYNFTVVATDEAGNESEQAVSLDINDVDEIAPEITSGTTAADIDENSGANQVVYTVTATDDNAITYSLSGDDASLFTIAAITGIGAATGEVTLIADPDYETQSSYSFNVVATDEAGNASEQAVSLDINDLDDTAPINTFTDAAYDEASNTLTLTGTNMNTLLSDAEDAATDIKDNLNWDNLTWDINTDNNDSDNVSFSLSDIDSVSVQDDNTLTITLTDTAATTLESTTDFDAFTDNDSVSITEGFSGDTAGNVSITDSFERDTSIVVFDLDNGESSSHSDRSFDVNVSYTIYIVVDSNSNNLNSNFTQWSEGNNLGIDDYVVLVSSDGNRILGDNGKSITNSNSGTGGSSLAYQTESGVAAYLFTDGPFARLFSGVRNTVDLWSGAGSTSTRMNGLNDAFTLTAMPAGILTSQGLV